MGAALRDADLIDRKTLGKIADFIFGPISPLAPQGPVPWPAPACRTKVGVGSNGGSHDQS